ncbi:Protein of unknown function DUF58 [Spirosomataceae bacterium TFI 002]|nr:Protein of unknown function DUF58 [Spirosomataceae bacterium TFI 002]
MSKELDLKKIREFGNIELLAKQMVEGFITGLHKSPFHGFSVEFAEHRLYNNGESTRHIDWKVFGKTDKLFTKRYEEETNLRCHLVVDVSSSMYYPEKTHGKLVFASMAAAALANMLQRQRDAVSLTTFADGIELQTQVKSTPRHLHQIYVELEKVLKSEPKNKSTNVAETLHLLADQFHRRSMVVIFSDMFDRIDNPDAIFAAMQHLRHNNHEVIVFHISDQKTEKNFEFDERPYEFVDIESGQKIKAQPSQVKELYTTALNKYYHELKLRCGQYKIDFVEVDIAQGFQQVFLSFLKRRAKMR